MAAPELGITVYGKSFARKGFVGDPVSVSMTLRHNMPSTATIEVASDHTYLPALMAAGARVVIDYDGTQVLSGPIRSAEGFGSPDGSVTLSVEDDWRLLTRVLGWPNPTGAISAQGAATAYDTKTAPAETVLKWFAGRAVTRLGLPVTIATDLGRGSTITVQMRMHPLADRLLPAIDQAGIGVTVRQVGAGLVVDCYTPSTYPYTLDPESGIVAAWKWSRSGPTATRTVIGGGGEGTAREFRERVNATAASDWGDVVEVFTDARDVSTAGEMDARGDVALAEGMPRSGLSLELAETDTFRYGRGLVRGDLVPVQLVPGAPLITDVLREATLTYTRDAGLQVQPVVGDRTDDPDRTLWGAVAKTLAAVRNINARS